MKLMNDSHIAEDKDALLISVKEASKILGIGRNTLLKLSKIKGFPAILLPR